MYVNRESVITKECIAKYSNKHNEQIELIHNVCVCLCMFICPGHQN